MSNENEPTASESRRDAVVASNHRFGAVLSGIGFALTVIVVVFLLLSGLMATRTVERDSAEESARALVFTVTVGVLPVMLLFAMCGLVAGEQLRRGSFGKARGLTVSNFRMLSFRWHALWIGVGLLVSGFLLTAPTLSIVTGGWPYSTGDETDITQFWIIFGALGFAVTIVSIGSFAKKVVWLRAVRADPGKLAGGGGRAFWRLFDYRWRFDLWVTGIGGLAVALSVTFLRPLVDPGSARDVAGAESWFIALVAGGLFLIVAGAICSRQFWRGGVALNSGEGVR